MQRFPVNPFGYALLAAALALPASSFAMGQEPRESPDTQSSTQARDNGQATENSFAGRIVKGKKGKLVLEDTAKGTSLVLDNQQLAKKYVGKNVVIAGTLDENNNVLHIKKIELAA